MAPNDMSLSIPVDQHGSAMYESNYALQSPSDTVASDMYGSPSAHHEINFEGYIGGGGGPLQDNLAAMSGNVYYNQDRSYPSPRYGGEQVRSMLFEGKQVEYPPFNGPLSPPPAPFLIGGMQLQQQHHHQPHHPHNADFPNVAEQFIPQSTVTTTTTPFNKDSVPQPAQMQLEIARKAHIPLFLHSPMYVRTTKTRFFEIQSQQEEHLSEERGQEYQQQQYEALQQQPVNNGNQYNNNENAMTPGKSQKLPLQYQNNSLHIDFAELKLQEMIGQGAFGTVHRANWRGTTVAVKILVCQTLTTDVLEEFETEVQIMSILRHPNICLLMGACLNPPTRCLVVEYLPKGSLWNVLRQDIVIDHEKQMSFTKDTALGMNYLHSFQPPILHRDLKSPNLLVDSSYAIKISDFGLARVRAHFQTMTGNCGTTQWMAPEVLAAEKYTEKADIFSFGVVVWEIITRACPYEGLCQIQAALGVLNNNLRPTIPSDCPPMFKKLMLLCWANVPEQRPTFEAILEILNSVEQGQVVTNRQMEDLADPSTQV
jgi:tRNA A-37 threonylcarbamoyl transferase component Bud32